jgi:hypothetical protein
VLLDEVAPPVPVLVVVPVLAVPPPPEPPLPELQPAAGAKVSPMPIAICRSQAARIMLRSL